MSEVGEIKTMFTKSQLKQIKKDIQDFFEKMEFVVDIEISEQDQSLAINLKAEEPQILIGEKGRILFCIQRVLQAMISRKFENRFYLDLDINDYKNKKSQYLKGLANKTADDVVLAQEQRVLTPMSGYERRLIHLELSSRNDVITESIGVEPERSVVIKPN